MFLSIVYKYVYHIDNFISFVKDTDLIYSNHFYTFLDIIRKTYS